MGYESRLYVVEKSTLTEDNGLRYAYIVATFNMCVCPVTYNLRNNPETDCYFYEDNGDTRVFEDRYGKPLTETTISDVVLMLEEAINSGEDYRRLFPLLAALKEFKRLSDNGKWENLVVLLYGY